MVKITSKKPKEKQGHYSPGVISNGNLYISGQLAIDPNTNNLVSGGVEAHAKMTLDNVRMVLEDAGLGPDNVTQCRVYISNIDDWEIVDKVYSDFFGDHMPARIVLPVGKLHYGSLIEIEAIAEVV